MTVPPGIDLTHCIPAALRSSVLAGVHEAEHRRVTVAFINFAEVDELLERLGPAETGRRLDLLVRRVQQAADRWSITFLGSDIARDGGKLILAAEHRPARETTSAGCSLRCERSSKGSPPVPLRIGVNRGSVFVGDIGPHYRRTFTVMGDAVNLAARLMAKAEPGQILATEGVLEASRTDFDTDGPRALPGEGQGRTGRGIVGRRRPRRSSGRRLLRAPDRPRRRSSRSCSKRPRDAVEGEGSIVELVGEPGMGKSRLVAELRHRTPQMQQLALSCEPYESSTAYFAWYDLMFSLLGFENGMSDDERRNRLKDVVERERARAAPVDAAARRDRRPADGRH